MANRYWLLSTCTFTTDSTLTTICWLTGGENDLTWNPHPTEYYPYAEVKITGDGDGVGLGYANFKWSSGDGYLTMEQWAYLMGFFVGNEPTTTVCVRTRVDTWTTNVFGEFEFQYQWFQAVMHRPTGEFAPGFRVRNVTVSFTHAVPI